MQPWNIAHRGGARLRPENTLTAFRHAASLGCDGAELDVQLAHDNEVVVFHDFHLTANTCRDVAGNWLSPPLPRIKDLTLQELKRYDIGRAVPGGAYEKKHPAVEWQDDLRIPTLAEVIGATKSATRSFRLFVELKTCFSNREASASPEALALRAVQVAGAHNILDRTTFVSFDWRGLLHVKRINSSAQCWFTTMPQSWFGEAAPPSAADPPDPHVLEVLRHWAKEGVSPWAAGFDAIRHEGSIVKAIMAAGGQGWFGYRTDVTAERVKEAHALGLKVGVWTVNDPEEMRLMAKCGVDAICTDRPDLLAENC
jgi:glycerophosphoryl diester phosphodiesterase